MAWIKMRTNLATDPRIVNIAALTNKHPCAVVGALHFLWSLADEHTEDGKLSGYTTTALDRMVGIKGFCNALQDKLVRWLEIDADQNICIPDFDVHNGESAKRRAQEQAKKQAQRRKPVPQVSPQNGDRCPAYGEGQVSRFGGDQIREEKIREEKNKKEERVPLSPAATPSRLLGVGDLPTVPPEIDSEQTRAAWGEFVAMRNRMAKAKRMTVSAASAIFRKLIPFGPVIAASALNDAVAGCYQGVFPEKFNGANQNGHGKQSVIDGRRAEKSAREFPDDAQLPIAR